MGKFVISTRKNGDYQFSLKAGNGQVILASQGYKSRSACDNGIESVKKNSSDPSKFERLTASNGKFYFNLKSANGQIVGKSQMYEAESGMENGIRSVSKNAPNASVEEDLA
ncbi:MAG: hypothetical protein CSA38_01555 [Flavobacteriales bacterium]|nr:MAG: hypothetical protein CSA38_01555 [Flavobacteriales bacterium]